MEPAFKSRPLTPRGMCVHSREALRHVGSRSCRVGENGLAPPWNQCHPSRGYANTGMLPPESSNSHNSRLEALPRQGSLRWPRVSRLGQAISTSRATTSLETLKPSSRMGLW